MPIEKCKFCGSGAYQADHPGRTSDVGSTLFHCYTHVKVIDGFISWNQSPKCLENQRNILIQKGEELDSRITMLNACVLAAKEKLAKVKQSLELLNTRKETVK